MFVIHGFYSILALSLLWIASGLIVSSIERVSRAIKTSSFLVSFLVLGMLTSITEMSVGINSVITNDPSIFVGNLIGGTLVILLFIIPLLALFNKGIRFDRHLRSGHLLFFLLLVSAPIVIVANKSVSLFEAGFLIVFYILFIYTVEKAERNKAVAHDVVKHRPLPTATLLINLAKIVIGAGIIFAVSKVLIREIEYFAVLFQIPTFLISILILSIGTNIPELSIAIRSIRQKKIEIAFGDYIGSAAANIMLFGIFAFMSGTFKLNTGNFTLISLIVLIGYILFFFFAKSKHRLSPREGIILIVIAGIFFLLQAIEIITLSTT